MKYYVSWQTGKSKNHRTVGTMEFGDAQTFAYLLRSYTLVNQGSVAVYQENNVKLDYI